MDRIVDIIVDIIVDRIVDIMIKDGLLISKAAEQHKRPRLRGSLSVIAIIVIVIVVIIFDADDDKCRRCWKAGGWWEAGPLPGPSPNPSSTTGHSYQSHSDPLQPSKKTPQKT